MYLLTRVAEPLSSLSRPSSKILSQAVQDGVSALGGHCEGLFGHFCHSDF